jgi:hypothetical protein
MCANPWGLATLGGDGGDGCAVPRRASPCHTPLAGRGGPLGRHGSVDGQRPGPRLAEPLGCAMHGQGLGDPVQGALGNALLTGELLETFSVHAAEAEGVGEPILGIIKGRLPPSGSSGGSDWLRSARASIRPPPSSSERLAAASTTRASAPKASEPVTRSTRSRAAVPLVKCEIPRTAQRTAATSSTRGGSARRTSALWVGSNPRRRRTTTTCPLGRAGTSRTAGGEPRRATTPPRRGRGRTEGRGAPLCRLPGAGRSPPVGCRSIA